VPKDLSRLQTLVQRGRNETDALWPDVRVASGWVHRAAHILNNDDQLAGAAVTRRRQGLLGAMAQHQARAGALAPAVDHCVKVSRSDWPGLFPC
jgi:hypothetical protein